MKTFEVNKDIKIEAEYYETRYSWGHKAYLYLNGEQVGYKKITYYNRTWERYTFESILYAIVESSKALSKEQKAEAVNYIKHYDDVESRQALKSVANIAKLGAIFGSNQKESNDWKARMLKAGLEDKGLIMPEDWDTLDEDTKTARLDAVIAELGK